MGMKLRKTHTRRSRVFGVDRRLRLLTVVAVVAAIGLSTHTVHAQPTYTFVVNTTADTNDTTLGDGVCNDSTGKCSLRAATQEASFVGYPLGTTFTIQVPAGTYVLTLGQLLLTNTNATATITGAGASTTIVTANGASRDFYVHEGATSIRGLTITGGNGTGAGGGFAGAGGGIYADRALTLVNDSISTNTITTGIGQGGGLYVTGSFPLSVQSSTVNGNSITEPFSVAEGGGLWIDPFPTATIRSSTFSGNSVTGAISEGGGIWTFAQSVTINSTQVTNNMAKGPTGGGTFVVGGGIFSEGHTQLSQVNVSNNQTTTGTAGTAEGGGIWTSGSFSVTGGTITNNTASAVVTTGGAPRVEGGGIWNVGAFFIGGSAVVNNNRATASTGAGGTSLVEGGGAWNNGQWTSILVHFQVNKATASTSGTGSSALALGGGLFNIFAVVSGQDTSFVGNSASATGAPVATSNLGEGGGIFTTGFGEMSLNGGFIQQNSATRYGGGMFVDAGTPYGAVSLTNSSVTRNTAGVQTGGIYNQSFLSLTNPGVANNTAPPPCPNLLMPCR